MLKFIFSLIVILNSFKAFRAVKKQWHEKIESVNVVMYITIIFDLILIFLLQMEYLISKNLIGFYSQVDPMIFFIIIFVIHVRYNI